MSVSSLLSTIAPQFDITTGRDNFISIASLQVNSCLFGAKADLATAYLSAHFIALFTDPIRRRGEAGSMISKREGDLSVGFGNFAKVNGADGALGSTTYGQQFLLLKSQTLSTLYVIGSGNPCG